MISSLCIAMTIAVLQGDASALRTETDAVRRAEAVLPLFDAGDPRLDAEARAVLVRCGPAAAPVLRQLIADELRPDRFSFLATLVAASGKQCVPDLERWLREETVYWRNLGMNLDTEEKISRPRVQFVVELLTHLHAFGYRDEHGLVATLRDQFRDHPLLESSPVVLAANRLLAGQ